MELIQKMVIYSLHFLTKEISRAELSELRKDINAYKIENGYKFEEVFW